MKKGVKMLNLNLYRKIYLSRKAEEKIIREYPKNNMKTPMHMSMGEEAIAAGICQALGPDSQVLSSYRSHAIYLSKTGETEKFFGELHGKVTGPAKGKAGSMHLSSPEKGYVSASAVVATQIPVAVGVAFANKKLKRKTVTAVFFGDGAMDEGAFWESLNMACLWKVPIIFVCEDNNLAIHTTKLDRQGYSSAPKIISKFNCTVFDINTTDPEYIYNVTKKAMKEIKKNQKPVFMRCVYYRYLEHVGINHDFNAGYRSKSEFKKWLKKDPLKIQREKLVKNGAKKELLSIEKEIDALINTGWQKAVKAKFPKEKEIYTDIGL